MALAEIARISNAKYLKKNNNTMTFAEQTYNLSNPYCILAPPANQVTTLNMIWQKFRNKYLNTFIFTACRYENNACCW